mmetsp:Transcript_46745/g.86766  ORF Transcript_46745/g.86766 Transcript_46745/m.86766 type:complete len:89 (-) Transcript_46745:26-292(-)
MIIVPPMQSATTMRADQNEIKPSARERVDAVQKARRVMRREAARIEYHHPAISFLDEPPQRLFARQVEYCDMEAPIFSFLSSCSYQTP